MRMIDNLAFAMLQVVLILLKEEAHLISELAEVNKSVAVLV